MTFKQFITMMIIATASLWIGWAWVVSSVDPFATGFLGFVLFYGVLFLVLIGTFTLIGVYLRKKRIEQALLFHIVLLSFRQSIVLSVFFIVLLFLQGQRLLFWWNVLLLLLAVFEVEYFILRRERRKFPPVISSQSIADSGFSPRFTKREIADSEEPYFEVSEVADVEIDLY